jgi:hypothetical protein
MVRAGPQREHAKCVACSPAHGGGGEEGGGDGCGVSAVVRGVRMWVVVVLVVKVVVVRG